MLYCKTIFCVQLKIEHLFKYVEVNVKCPHWPGYINSVSTRRAQCSLACVLHHSRYCSRGINKPQLHGCYLNVSIYTAMTVPYDPPPSINTATILSDTALLSTNDIILLKRLHRSKQFRIETFNNGWVYESFGLWATHDVTSSGSWVLCIVMNDQYVPVKHHHQWINYKVRTRGTTTRVWT